MMVSHSVGLKRQEAVDAEVAFQIRQRKDAEAQVELDDCLDRDRLR